MIHEIMVPCAFVIHPNTIYQRHPLINKSLSHYVTNKKSKLVAREYPLYASPLQVLERTSIEPPSPRRVMEEFPY